MQLLESNYQQGIGSIETRALRQWCRAIFTKEPAADVLKWKPAGLHLKTAKLDLWIEWFLTLLALNDRGPHLFRRPSRGGSSHKTVGEIDAQLVENDFSQEKGKSQQHVSHHLGFHQDDLKKHLTQKLTMYCNTSPSVSPLTGHFCSEPH